jgi:hypothetical protein
MRARAKRPRQPRWFNTVAARANLLVVLFLLWAPSDLLRAAAVELQPAGIYQRVAIGQVNAWQAPGEITFGTPGAILSLGPAASLYVRVVYLDAGKGLLSVMYPSSGGMFASQVHTRSSRVGTGDFVSSYHELSGPFPGAAGQGALTIKVIGSDGTPLTIRSVSVQTVPFPDPEFLTAVRRPWRQPLRFPVTDASPAQTLKGRVMVGFQGWFRTANDRDDDGWGHWFRSKTDPSPAFFKFDMWPDTSAYPVADRVRAGSILTKSGQPANLYSSTSEAVVQQQFSWLRQNHIDGAFVQRFLGDRRGGDDGTPEWVLMNARKAANAEKRLWAITYDVTGMPPSTAEEVLRRDWRWLKDDLKVTADPYYAHENGKPVVFVWGLSSPSRNFPVSVANRIVDFLHNDRELGGNYVIGSMPIQWTKLAPEWYDHARKYDGLQMWMTHDYALDKRTCDQWHVDYYAHVWPGFSRAHLANSGHVPDAFTDRAGGRFFRERISQALAAGCDRLFVGMLDEYDEGTAIMPMSDDPPLPGPPAGRFVTNAGAPADRWLRIAGEAEQALATSSPARNFSAEQR